MAEISLQGGISAFTLTIDAIKAIPFLHAELQNNRAMIAANDLRINFCID